MERNLAGKSALVTGAGRGIGRAIALALAARGMRLGLLARSPGQLEQVAAEVAAAGGEALPRACDLADLSALPGVVAELLEPLEPVTVLVNNAGVFHESAVAEQQLDVWEYVLRVNLTAPMLLCRELLPGMIAAGEGRIINIASTAAVQGYAEQGAYSASKHGLLGLGRCLALEVKAHNIHVHTVCPGGVETTILTGTRLGERLAGQVKLAPENVAAMVAFLVAQPDNVDLPEVVMRRFRAS